MFKKFLKTLFFTFSIAAAAQKALLEEDLTAYRQSVLENLPEIIEQGTLYINNGYPEALYAVYIEEAGSNKKQIAQITENYKNQCLEKIENAAGEIKELIEFGLEAGEVALNENESLLPAFITPFEHQAEKYVQEVEKLGAKTRMQKITITTVDPK